MDRKDLELVLAIRNQACLEFELGLPLFHRTTQRVSTTAEGELVCTQAIYLLQRFSSFELALQALITESTGLIRLVATFEFGRLCLGPALRQTMPCEMPMITGWHLTEPKPLNASARALTF